MKHGTGIRAAAATAIIAAAIALSALAPAPARGDVIHLREGGQVEGEIVEKTNRIIRVKGRRGAVTLPLSRVLRIEEKPVSWKVYEELAAKCEQTADAHYRLAVWCVDNDLDDLAAIHFARALELDPNHAATRATLGHAKVGDAWLELDKEPAAKPDNGNPPARPAAVDDPNDPRAIEAARMAMAEAEREMVRMIRGEWYKRIRMIRSSYLNSALKSRFNVGAEMLLNIHDPLAVEPMMHQLSDGTPEERKLLVRALTQFHTSAATMGLLEGALLDDEPEVRRIALVELESREDPRILAYLLKALASEDDDVVRNSADAIGFLRFTEAVPHLVKALTEKQTRRVRTEDVVKLMRQNFIDENGQLRSLVIRRTRSDPFHTRTHKVTVTLFRTEVQEALIAITGENYGFDGDAWMAWYRRNVVKKRVRNAAGPAGGPPAVPPAGN